MGMLLILAWMAAVLYASIPCYWFLVHPLVNFWRQKRFPFRTILPLWLVIIALLAALTWPWRMLRLYETPWAWLAAVALFAWASWSIAGCPRNSGLETLPDTPSCFRRMQPQRQRQNL